MTRTNMKRVVGLAASLAVVGGAAFGQSAPTIAVDQDLLLASLYAEMDAAREKTEFFVLAKAQSHVVKRLAMREYLPTPPPNLNRFVLAHLEP